MSSPLAQLLPQLLLLLVLSIFAFEIEPANANSSETRAARSRHTLQQDLFEFIDLIPIDETNELRVRYYVSDPRVRDAYDFMRDADYAFVRERVVMLPEVKWFLRYLDAMEVNLTAVGEAIYERLGPPNQEIHVDEVPATQTGGFNALLTDILDTVPQEDVITLFFDKLDTSAEFSNFCKKIGSKDFENMLNALRACKEVQLFAFQLREHGIDLMKLFHLVKTYFGFGM